MKECKHPMIHRKQCHENPRDNIVQDTIMPITTYCELSVPCSGSMKTIKGLSAVIRKLYFQGEEYG